VTAIDNLITRDHDNIAYPFGVESFTVIRHDITNFLHVPSEVDYVMHFALPRRRSNI